MAQTDRTTGLVGNAAFKVPCRAATTANLTLSGEQTVDGVACVDGDRVLVKNQTDQTDNGIYVVDTGSWARAKDFDGTHDVVTGSLVIVNEGSTNINTYWRCTTADEVVIDTDNITFAQALLSDLTVASFLQAGTGAVARTGQSKMRDVVSVKDFGAAGDDATDDTAAIEAAIAYCKNGVAALYFPAGIYRFDKTLVSPTFGLYINQALTIYGDGIDETFLKNMSATAAGIRCAATVNLSGFTLDQNGSTGKGVTINGQYSQLNFRVDNQGGSSYAVNLDGATCAVAHIEIVDSTNGLRLGETLPTNYVRLNSPTIEVNSGTAFKAEICSGCSFDLYLDTNATGNQTKLLDIDNCEEMSIRLSCETGSTHTLTDAAYFDIARSRSINFRGGRINHTGTASKSIFRVTGATLSNGVSWDGMELISTKTGMTMFDLAGSASSFNIEIKNITTNLTSAAGGVVTTTAQQMLHIENWNDKTAASTHTLDATGLLGINIENNIAVTARDRQTFINCAGTFSGTGADTCMRIHSAGSERGTRGIRRKLVTVTRDLTTASGSVATTGVGFKPQSLEIIATINASNHIFSTGFANYELDQRCIYQYPSATPSWNASAAACVKLATDASQADNQTAVIAAMGDDGFTLTWTKTGTPSGTATLYVMASQ